jgi:hypothetical protein
MHTIALKTGLMIKTIIMAAMLIIASAQSVLVQSVGQQGRVINSGFQAGPVHRRSGGGAGYHPPA